MTTAPQRIALFGHFGSGNLGNEGSLEAILNFLKRVRPDAKHSCICAVPEQVRRDYQLPGHHINWRPKSPLYRKIDKVFLKVPGGLIDLIKKIIHARNLDLIIVPGTGILDDFGIGPSGVTYGLFSWCAAAKLCGTKIVFVSVGAGPIDHPVSRFFLKFAAGTAQYRSYRDKFSKDFMTGIGFDTTNDPIYPDVAFALPGPAPEEPARRSDERLTIGVGVMPYNGWRPDVSSDDKIYKTYLAKITAFTLWLLEQGYRVRVLIGELSDEVAVKELLDAVNTEKPRLANGQIFFEPAFSLHDIMQQIAKTDIVVTTRFHNVVCAIKVGKPTLSISYSKKNDALMAEMGIGAYCQFIEDLNVQRLQDQFLNLVADRQNCEKSIAEGKSKYEAYLAEQEAFIASHFL